MGINDPMKMNNTEKKPKSDETIEELQAELVRLQRQFRLLEDDRKSYREETEYILKKQQDTIQSLNEEYEELGKDTKLACSLKNQTYDRENVLILKELLEQESIVKEDLEVQSLRNRALNRSISRLQSTTDLFRKKMGGCNSPELRYKAIIKSNRVMENRLNDAKVKFNIALSENRELRDEIDHINQQRIRFSELQKKLTKLLQAGKDEKDILIEKSTVLFNSRDEAQHRMQSLRERSERDMNSFTSELKDLLRVIDHDKNLREFMRTKMEERNEIYEAAVNGRKEKKLLDYIKGLQVEVEHFESIFNDLFQVSGIIDIDEMVQKFIKVEDENFALFNFVKDQSEQVQQNEATVEDLTRQIETMEKENIRVEKKQKEIIEHLKYSEHAYYQQHQILVQQIKAEERVLENVCTKINETLDRIKCDRSVMSEILGGSKINKQNLLSYLGLIEQKAAELSQTKLMSQTKKGEEISGASQENHLISFATLGRMARQLISLPTFTADLPDSTSAVADTVTVRPISQKEAREMAITLNKELHHSKTNLTPDKTQR